MGYIGKEHKQGAIQVTTGDLSVSVTPPTQGVKKDCRMKVTSGVTIPAGAYYVEIRHVDPVNHGVTVNGKPIEFGDIFADTAQTDQVNNIQDFVPEISIINTNNAHLDVFVSYPSSSQVDPCNL